MLLHNVPKLMVCFPCKYIEMYTDGRQMDLSGLGIDVKLIERKKERNAKLGSLQLLGRHSLPPTPIFPISNTTENPDYQQN